MVMSIGSSANVSKAIRGGSILVGAAVGITTTLNVAAAKYNPNASMTMKAGIILARILGPQLAGQILQPAFPGTPPNSIIVGVPQGIAPFGWANTSTYGGALTLIVNHIIKNFAGITAYNKYAAPFIHALGSGLLAGGVIGGLLDPPPDGSGGSSFLASPQLMGLSPQSAPQQSMQPYRSATAVRLHGR